MLARILGLIETRKRVLLRPRAAAAAATAAAVLLVRQRKLGVDEPHAVLAALLDILKHVHALELKVHAVGRVEVFKEGEQLDDVLALDYLDAGVVGLEAFVDGHDHAAARDAKV